MTQFGTSCVFSVSLTQLIKIGENHRV